MYLSVCLSIYLSIYIDRGAALDARDGVQLRLERLDPLPVLSPKVHLFISFRRSIPQQHRQINILISNSRQQLDDFVGDLTFLN